MKNLLSVMTIFWGAFLVFGVQPMVGNTLLPVFGGTAAVWTVCLCAFQIMLLAGYFYAHIVAQKRKEKQGAKKVWGHIGLLFASAIWIAVVALNRKALLGWAGATSFPALEALVAVVLLVGLPYILLSSNSSLVQAWVADPNKRNVYRLYAVSNAGSFCGLLAYPLLIEPNLPLHVQWATFGAGLAAYGVLLTMLARCVTVTNVGDTQEPSTPIRLTFDFNSLEWLGLSALSCFLLNGVTAHLCNDVTPLPLLWAALLAIYLASYIIGFTEWGAKIGLWMVLPVVGLVAVGAWHLGIPTGRGFAWELAIGCALILFGGWLVHSRLYRKRPGNERVTVYYLMIALGGAIGGTVASLVFPTACNFVAEYPVTLVALAFICILEIVDIFKKYGANGLDWKWVGGILVVLAFIVFSRANIGSGRTILKMRNFYGCGRVLTEDMTVSGGIGYTAHVFEHAGVMHGFQPTDPYKRGTPTLCFTPHAGGLSIERHPSYTNGAPMRVAVAGMGMATLAAYARTNDVYRFYEINPQVAKLAQNTNYFWYVSDCKGKLDIVVDDARRALEKERERNEPKWDVLIIDVFSGDAIPPHMSTKEAVQLYLDRLAPGGVLSFHLTNWHLALSPMVKAAAKEFNLHLQGYGCWADRFSHGSYWTFLTREPQNFFIEGKHGKVNYSKIEDMPLMTDEKHSLLPYLSSNPMPDFE